VTCGWKRTWQPPFFWINHSIIVPLFFVSGIPNCGCFMFFLLQNPQWNQRMNSHEPCIWLKVKYSISWMEPVGNFMGICIDLLKRKQQLTRKQIKLQLLKIKNLQHKTSLLTCIYIFPLVTNKDFSFDGKYALICLYEI
jgi:hypothetical protein